MREALLALCLSVVLPPSAAPVPIRTESTSTIMPMPDAKVWEDIRRAYCASNETLGAIARRHGIAHIQISARARRDGWPPRPEAARATKQPQAKKSKSRKVKPGKVIPGKVIPAARAKPAAPMSAPPSNVVVLKRSATLTRSLVKAARQRLAEKLDNLRIQLNDGKRRKSTESERESRDLLGIINGIAKTQDIEHELTRHTHSPAAAKSGAGAADAADLKARASELRRRLARDLAHRRGSRDDRGGSGTSD